MLDLINYIFRDKLTIIPEEISSKGKYKILISFVSPDKGKTLLKVANSLVKKQGGNTIVTAMHLSLTSEMHSFDVKDQEKEAFLPVVSESERLNQKITTLFKVSNDIDSEVTETANHGEYDLLLVGLGHSIFEGTLLGKVLGFTTRIINPDRLIDKITGKEGLFENSPFDERTRQIVTNSKMPVGILVDKKLEEIDRVFMPIFAKEDGFLIEFAQKLIHNNGSQITVLDDVGEARSTRDIQEAVRAIEQIAPNHIMMMQERTIKKEFLEQQDLMIISLESWKKLIDSHSTWLNNTPSVLIIKP